MPSARVLWLIVQLFPCQSTLLDMISVSKSLCLVFFGLPRFLVPCGFHLRACACDAGIGFPDSVAVIAIVSAWSVDVQDPPVLRQLLMNVCTFIVVISVVLHLSDP